MKNKIIELIKEYQEKFTKLDMTNNAHIESDDLFDDIASKIQALEFPVTLDEVKNCCIKKDKLCPLKKGMFNCQITKDPCDWDIEEITKAVRHG